MYDETFLHLELDIDGVITEFAAANFDYEAKRFNFSEKTGRALGTG